jgi:hypothetical protein
MSKIKTPLELLQDEFNIYKKALSKSTKSFEDGIITKELHETHVTNLIPIIASYKRAIEILDLHFNFKK